MKAWGAWPVGAGEGDTGATRKLWARRLLTAVFVVTALQVYVCVKTCHLYFKHVRFVACQLHVIKLFFKKMFGKELGEMVRIEV